MHEPRGRVQFEIFVKKLQVLLYSKLPKKNYVITFNNIHGKKYEIAYHNYLEAKRADQVQK